MDEPGSVALIVWDRATDLGLLAEYPLLAFGPSDTTHDHIDNFIVFSCIFVYIIL
jgi:hypothetical protein